MFHLAAHGDVGDYPCADMRRCPFCRLARLAVSYRRQIGLQPVAALHIPKGAVTGHILGSP